MEARRGRCTMPVAGGRAQKRVNERTTNHNLDPGSLQHHRDVLQEVAGWHMEDWEELEALLETEHLILGQPYQPQQHQQQQHHRSDINLLQSPERTPRLPHEAPPSRSSSRRSLPRTHGAYSLPLQQLSSILLNMTFSDAEDEHQGTGRNTSNSQDRSLSRSRTESGVSNASTVSLASPSSSAGPAAAANGPMAASGSAAGALDIAAAQNASVVDVSGVDKKKIVEKLQQIQGYIQQTTAAMAALEQQGDIAKVGQYNTLAKILRDLRSTEAKLKAQGGQYAEAAAQVANGTQHPSTAPSSVSPASAQVNGREETAPEEGSRVVGVVGSENVRTLQDRLSASQEESVAIMSQMRASIARREDLLTRYKATQERLANLKRQRQGIQEEKQRLIQQGANPNGAGQEDEDPIPGADTWTLSELTKALVDFQALQDKVERLTAVYSTRAQGVDPDDAESQADVASKLGQLATKRRQLADVLTRLKGYQALRQQEERDGLDGVGGSGRSTSTAPAGASDANHLPASSNTHTTTTSDEPAPPPPPPPPSASLSASVSNINGEGHPVSPASLREAANSVTQASEELVNRKAQLNSLQKQLSDMKKLLDVANKARQEFGDDGAGALPSTSAAADVPTEILEVSGKRIVLTEAERQNPEIASKYSQLSRAKDRLAKMEEIIAMISQARHTGQNLRDVIPPDYLAILEEAENNPQAEFAAESGGPGPLSRASAPLQRPLEVEEEEVGRLSRRPTRPPRMGSMGRGEAGAGAGAGRDSQVREQESREISAMQQRLNKNSTRVSAINEGSQHGHEKGAIKKQPQALWQGSSSGGGGGVASSGVGGVREDPRLAQVLAMQEELRQKKNALEALMRRMGKSSSLNMDNISDNISDNVSEASDRLGDVRGSGGAATWGEAGGLHHFSDNHYQQSSDEDLIDEDEADLPPRGSQLRPQQPPPIAVSPKDRNRHSTSRHRRRQDSGRLSVNNLTAATLPTPARTKHNRLRASSAPKALWESVGTPLDGSNYKSPSNTTMQTQHSLNAALSQLTQVQGTINNLQESLRHEQSQVLGSSRASLYQPQLVPPLLPDLTPTSLPPMVTPSQALTPMSAYAGLGSLALAAQGGGEAVNQQLLSGLQQCFSQLHLHSLEIQALSKHLQLLERRDQTSSAAMADVGDGLGRGGRGGARRSEEEEEEEDNEDDDVAGDPRPPYPLHHNLLAAAGLRPGKEGGSSRAPQGSAYPVYLRQQSESGAPSSGVTNPIYGHLGDLRDQTGGTWGSLAPTPGTEQPTDTLGSLLGPGAPGEALEGSSSHPLLHLGRMGEEASQTQAPEAHHWASLASTHPLHHQTTDLLNNQVPPGTRANNYWDNFRSYSRQNLLSTATKSNTSDLHPPSTTSTSAPAHTASFALHQGREGGRGEDKRFNVSLGHNNTNSGAGARSRMPNPHINNPRGAANPRVRNPVAASSQHLLSQNKHKANNRNKQGDLWVTSKGSERNLPPQDRGSGGRNLGGYLNYNTVRANTSDSDGAEGSGVTLEVLREAEALIRRHANQPEFLLQLFRHASQITVHTDQHVAVALLHDLASQPHRPGSHGVNANPGPGVHGHAEGTVGLSLPAPLRDSWRPQPPRSHPQNTLPQDNVSVVGLSGSEVSDSGLTSEDEDSRALYRNVKNLSLSPGGAVPPPAPPGGVNTGGRPPYPQPPPPLHPHYQHNYHEFPHHRQHNLVHPHNTQGGESARSGANSESSLYDHLVFNDSHLATRQEVVEDWVRRGVEEEEEEDEAGPSKLLNQADTAGSSPEDAHNLIHPLNNDTEYLTFETLVASAVREGTEVLQAQACEDVASPLLLNSLHHSLVAHIQTRAQSLRLPQTFLYSTDTELKSALQAFSGKPLSQVSSDVPSLISQVLLTQYCSVLVQRLRDNQPLLPQTPTKLPPGAPPKAGEVGLEGAAATPTAGPPECRPPQEATTATQTEAGVFSLHPQRPPLHTFSLTTGAAAAHPPPSASLSATTPADSPWQAPPPPPAPLPSPNHNPSGGESLAESAACAGGPLPTAPSGSWSAEGLASPASPLGAGRGEAEQEEAMMDELGEPTLVHTLAEADQSQDAVEGDWGEDSQAEGIMQPEVSGGAVGGSSHTHSPPQHPGWLPARERHNSSQLEAEAEVEGLVESEAEAAALGAGHLLFMDQQSQELDEVPTKLQSPQGGSPSDSPEQALPQQHHPHHPQRPHSPAGSEG
ncbi:uncharacterized protein LOC126981470 isoform X6 [Eriocheir sinensis]|uniref:uncharacterized protein LOC126981470 isoform X6 n=1 Tax=Eriocheir sinensis TaxID=95602 RepID=UPI0021C760AB|nr:uncharacterized protein LOC126981470 isoform X6 [Eriocheir sinensis]